MVLAIEGAASRGSLTDAERAQLLVVAAHLRDLHAERERVLLLVRRMVSSDSVAEVDCALAELIGWAVKGQPLNHG